MPRSPVTHSLSFPPPSPLPHSTTQPIVLLFTHLGCFFVSMIPALDLLSQATVLISLNHNFSILRLFLCNSAICILVEKAHLLTPKIENLNRRDAPSSLPPTCFVVVILKVACPIAIGSTNAMRATIWKGVLPETIEDIQKNKSHILWHGSQKIFLLMKTTEKTAQGEKNKRIVFFRALPELPNLPFIDRKCTF